MASSCLILKYNKYLHSFQMHLIMVLPIYKIYQRWLIQNG